MKTFQFIIPQGHLGKRQQFLDDLALEFEGLTAWGAMGAWVNKPVNLAHVEYEDVLVVQVSTSEGQILRDRVCAYLRNVEEQAAYFGHVGEHEVIRLNPGQSQGLSAMVISLNTERLEEELDELREIADIEQGG